MKIRRWRFVGGIVAMLALPLIFENCSGFQSSNGSGSASSSGTNTLTPPNYIGKNTFPVSVSSACSLDGYNGPCVSVTICTPGTSQCVTIDNILIDTGSTGLRVFQSLMGSVALRQINAPSGSPLAECYNYGDGSYGFWGPVQTADVMVGEEKATNVPVQVINSTYAGLPSTCEIGSFNSPSSAGVNGIMGVNQLVADCGSYCASNTDAEMYYSCSGGTCTASEAPVPSQPQNPVSMMPFDNNGLIIQLPTINAEGEVSVSGTAIMGIGTQTNNTPGVPVSVLTTDDYGYLNATFSGVTYTDNSVVDSGTPSYCLQSTSTLVDCSGQADIYFCPTSTQNLTASLSAVSGSNSANFSFSIANAGDLQDIYAAFDDVGWDNGQLGISPAPAIFGLTFFYGRSVYIGLGGKNTPIGAGPFVGF